MLHVAVFSFQLQLWLKSVQVPQKIADGLLIKILTETDKQVYYVGKSNETTWWKLEMKHKKCT